MKKNLSVNLFGSLYCIDEDAYELLDKYLANIKSYFSNRDGGEEIADDIEHRVAELFAELKNSGAEAVSIEDVQNIIKRIGNPEQMDDDVSEDERKDSLDEEHPNDESLGDNDRSTFGKRKLYRNTENQVIGGVLSGLCSYFGGTNPLPWRLIFVILAIATEIIPLFIIYLVLWALIPEASTPEERLKMKGRPVNIDTLNEEIISDHQNENKNPNKSLFNTLMTILGFCMKLFFGFLLGVILFVLITVGIALAIGFISPFSGFDSEPEILVNEFLAANPSVTVYMWISLISGIIFTSLILYSIIHSILKKNTGNRMSSFSRITLVIITILSVISCIIFGVATYNKVNGEINRYTHESNTVNGIYLSDNQHSRLANNGWHLDTYDNGSDKIYQRIVNFFDDDEVDLYLNFRREDSSKPMNVNIYRTEDFPAGSYHIEALVTSKCNGAYVYASADSLKTSAMIPASDAFNKGNIKDMTDAELRNTVFFDIDSNDEIWKDDDLRYRINFWSYVRSNSFHHDGGPLKYGVTNMSSVLGSDAVNTPAWSFNLRLIKIVADK